MRPFRSRPLAGLVIAGIVTAVLSLAIAGHEGRRLWGDEGTYVAMTASLAADRDLVFDETDLERILAHPDEPAPTVILQETRRGITYSKPLLYPLLSAPLYALMGESGMVATNLLTLGLALALAWAHWRRLTGSSQARWMLGTFVLCSALLAYLGWKVSDLVLLSLTLIGLVLALGGRRIERARSAVTMPFGSLGAAILGGLALGGAASMRYTTAALAAAVVGALVFDKRWRRAAVVAVLATTGFLAIVASSVGLQGTSNPYKAVRSSFNQDIGYPAGAAAAEAREHFASRPATQSATWIPRIDTRQTAYSTLYFFVGRHTGTLFYFPAAFVFLLALLRHPDRVSLPLLAGVLVIVGFYLVWMPENYFGGSTFVGNRYFLGAFPALFIALTRPPSRRTLAIAWLIAVVAWSSAAYSTWRFRDLDDSSQAHTVAGVFRRLPFESTAQRIDGLQDRFWAEDFVRFLDPFASAARWSFRLDAAHPAAEVLVAIDWQDQPLYFVVSPDPAEVEISVREGADWDRFSLPISSPQPAGIVEIPPSTPWRRHPYWWRPPGRVYNTRILRFSLESQGADGATAIVRYAGKGRELAPLSAELLGIEPTLPGSAPVGTELPITLSLHNTGRRPWRSQGLFPIKIGYRWVTGNQGAIASQAVMTLPANVPTGDTVEIPMTLRWPAEPGRYQLALDLIREPQGALGNLGRLVVFATEIRADPAANPDTPAP